jgi:hypothetical protein
MYSKMYFGIIWVVWLLFKKMGNFFPNHLVALTGVVPLSNTRLMDSLQTIMVFQEVLIYIYIRIKINKHPSLLPGIHVLNI